jgi:hypothetical protein
MVEIEAIFRFIFTSPMTLEISRTNFSSEITDQLSNNLIYLRPVYTDLTPISLKMYG